MAPAIPEADLKTRVEVKLGVMNQKKNKSGKQNEADKEIKTRAMTGRFPRWNWSKKPRTVTLAEHPEFASDMRVQLFQIEDSYYKGKNQVMVGQFLVPVASMLEGYERKTVRGNLYKRP